MKIIAKLIFVGVISTVFTSIIATATELNPVIEKKVLEQFPLVDKDNDGKFTGDELTFVHKLLIRKFPKADNNGDGVLSLTEQDGILKNVEGKASRKPTAKLPKPLPKPDLANVKYGDHERHVMDVWIADKSKVTPLALFIHGGGFHAGSKEKLKADELAELLEAGVSVAAINYRYKTIAPLPAAHHDARQSLQFIRSKASEWKVDKNRIGLFGSSAGAQISMWLAYSDDMANPESKNPVERESTRVTCVATAGGQTTLGYDFWKKLSEGFDLPFEPLNSQATYGVKTEEEANKIALSISALELVSADDPPIFMKYNMAPGDPLPSNRKASRGFMVHHVNLGLALKKKADELKVENYLNYKGVESKYKSMTDFLVDKLVK